jgi:rhodanese-related sulfurtransferase
MGSTANKHGRVIADCIAGDDEAFPGILGTAIFKIFDYNVGRTGISEREARNLGYDIECAVVPAPDRPHFYKGAKLIIIKLIAEKGTGKLLGAQIIGPGDVAKRLEIMVASLSCDGTVDQLSKFDLAYAPPFSPPMDNIIIAANVLRNKLSGRTQGCSPLEVKEKFDRGDDFIFLDVRSPQEYELMRIDHPAAKLMPLSKVQSQGQSLPRNKEIIVSCKTSLRAYEAYLILQSQGFTNIKFMDGGILAWPFEVFQK